MRQLIIVVFILLLINGNASAQEKLLVMEGCQMHSNILNKEIRYSVCLPEEYYNNLKQTYPVTYLLHGYGDDYTGWLEYGAADILLKRNIENGNAAPMILIIPDGFNTYYVNDYAGTFLYQDMFIKELVPHIDSVFRTIKDGRHRGLIGYSMGGFGAMMLHLKYPDVFGCTVPLSMSVRTDEQYMTEDASGWDDQWGRLFGAPGMIGENRITDYYKKNSPFHVLTSMNVAEKNRLKIFMLNGDDEETLCRSNEELHILMHQFGIPHEYRVVNGGHSFKVWREAMPYAMRFISDYFNGRDYAGDIKVSETGASMSSPNINISDSEPTSGRPFNAIKIPTDQTGNLHKNGITDIFVPADYDISNRKYPIIMIMGELDSIQRLKTAEKLYNHELVKDNCPVIVAFISSGYRERIPDIFKDIEVVARVRSGRKYRSLISLGGNGYKTLEMATSGFPVNVVVLTDSEINRTEAESFISKAEKEALNRLRIYIDNHDKSGFAEGNGTLHMLLRDIEHNHEYRVREGIHDSDGLTSGEKEFEWISNGLKEALDYVIINFHR